MTDIKIKNNQFSDAAAAVDYLYTHNKNFTKTQEENATILYYLFFKGVHPYKDEEPDKDAEKLQLIADRIYNILDPWEREHDTPAENIKAIQEEITKRPLDTIIFLLDRFDA